jgi:hypothetical protein
MAIDSQIEGPRAARAASSTITAGRAMMIAVTHEDAVSKNPP